MNDITSRFLEAYRWVIDNDKTPDTKTFAKELGISISMMTEISKERSNIGIKAIQNIVKKFHINSEWLIAGIGDMLREEQPPSQPVISANEFVYKELYREKDNEVKALLQNIWEMRSEIEMLQKENEALRKKDDICLKEEHHLQIENFTSDLDVDCFEQEVPLTPASFAGVHCARKARNPHIKK